MYRLSDNQFVTDIDYQLYRSGEFIEWSGELTAINGRTISENDFFLIELDDSRKITCRLRKKYNRAVSGMPSRHIYHFTGIGQID